MKALDCLVYLTGKLSISKRKLAKQALTSDKEKEINVAWYDLTLTWLIGSNPYFKYMDLNKQKAN